MKSSIKDSIEYKRKKFAVIFLLVFLALLAGIFGSKLLAQDSLSWKVKSISASAGESPLATGLSGSVSLLKGKSSLSLDLNMSLGQAIYCYSPIKQISFGPSGGTSIKFFGQVQYSASAFLMDI